MDFLFAALYAANCPSESIKVDALFLWYLWLVQRGFDVQGYTSAEVHIEMVSDTSARVLGGAQIISRLPSRVLTKHFSVDGQQVWKSLIAFTARRSW